MVDKKILFAAMVSFLFYADAAKAALVQCTGKDGECTLCDFFAMAANVVGFTLKFVVPAVALLAIICGGILFMVTRENPEIMEKAKAAFKTAAIGAIIAYAGWVLINVGLASFNSFNKDSWWKFEITCQYCGDGILGGSEECDYAQTVESCVARGGGDEAACKEILDNCTQKCKIKPKYCGDGEITAPEECDYAETVESCVARGGGDETDCSKSISGCSNDCKIKTCAGDSLTDKIGMGCWLTESPADPGYCDRGRYLCNPETNKVTCTPFNPPQRDECCADGGRALTASGMTFDIVRAQQYLDQLASGHGSTYTCDEICAFRGEVCIGVGLTNVATNKCVSIDHHEQGLCDLGENQTANNCRARYHVSGSECLENNPCQAGFEPCNTLAGIHKSNPALSVNVSYPMFTVGETACYCK